MKRDTITLRKPPDPQKVSLSERIGFRFVEKRGRYILQKNVVMYGDQLIPIGGTSLCVRAVTDSTWVDVPLVPETYGP